MKTALFKQSNKVKNLIQYLPRDIWRFGSHILNIPNHKGLAYFTPNANWATDWVGRYVVEQARLAGLNAFTTSTPQLLSDYLLHYADLGSFLANIDKPHNRRNKIVATIFHGYLDGDNKQLIVKVEKFIRMSNKLEAVVTASRIMQSRLTDWLPAQMPVYCLPIGVDGSKFQPASPLEKSKLRSDMNIPLDAFCIGSFQKDGEGWGAGNQPKLIKGPDVFLDTVAQLHSIVPNLFVILTAPARGYVINGLKKCGIPYIHHILDNYFDVARYYQLLDCYLVASREEGGPKAILESMASGVPLVSTCVGMAPDIICDGINGRLCEVEDVPGLVAAIEQVVSQPNVVRQMVKSGLNTSKKYDWTLIGQEYIKQVYAPLLSS